MLPPVGFLYRLPGQKSGEDGAGPEAVQFDDFVAGSVAAHEFDLATGATEGLREQPEQRFVGGGVNRRRGDLDSQLSPQRRADFVDGGARLQFDGEQQSTGPGPEERRDRGIAIDLPRRVFHAMFWAWCKDNLNARAGNHKYDDEFHQRFSLESVHENQMGTGAVVRENQLGRRRCLTLAT